MSSLLDIKEKLQATVALIGGYEKSLGQDAQNSESLLLNLHSLEKRRRKLQIEFDDLAQASGIDICSYKLLPDNGVARLASITSTLGDYQSLVSVCFDALKNGPKKTSKISADIAEATAFDFGYSFPGSIGFVLTIPNERLLLIGSELDETIKLIFRAAKASTSSEVLEFSRILGVAPIRTLYNWADSHARSGLSVDIEWRRGREVRNHVLLQRSDFERLETTISRTSDETNEELTVTGELVGADLPGKSFHFRPDGGQTDIRGKFTDGTINPSDETSHLGKRYRAILEMKTTILFSTEETRIAYTLNRLEPIV